MAGKKTHTVKGVVETGNPDGTTSTVEEQVATTKTDAQFCKVGHKMGVTINTGNFSSIRVDVWIEIPCTADEVDEAMDLATVWVDEKLGASVETIKKEYGL